MPDPKFAEPRLAATYDVFEDTRDDLDHYEQIIAELAPGGVVLDIGCGTGELACRLALRGVDVVGVDPAEASLDIARQKSGADRVRWIVGTIEAAPTACADIAVMTGNVAQVFLTDDEWNGVLHGAARALRPAGFLVFETRDPAQRAWEGWTPEATRTSADLPDGDRAETWCRITDVDLPLVTFRYTTVFASDGASLTSDSTLRFRERAELDEQLDAAGFDVVDVRDAPDRPGREWVYIARPRTARH